VVPLPVSQKVVISGEVLSQEISGETVLLDLASEKYFGLDAVGTRVWQLLSEEKPLDAVVEVIAGEYEVGREQLEADIGELLKSLVQAGLVSLVPPTG
jgi:hypothetical protein